MGRQPIEGRAAEHDQQHRHNEKQGEHDHEQDGHRPEQQPIAAVLEVVRLIEPAEDAIDAARRVEQHQHKTETRNFRVHSIGQEVFHGGFDQAECVPREIGPEGVKQTHLEVRNGHQRKQAQQHQNDRENRHEHLKRDGRSADAQGALHDAHHEEPKHRPCAHPLEAPRVNAHQRPNQNPPQRGLHHPLFPRLLTHGRSSLQSRQSGGAFEADVQANRAVGQPPQ